MLVRVTPRCLLALLLLTLLTAAPAAAWTSEVIRITACNASSPFQLFNITEISGKHNTYTIALAQPDPSAGPICVDCNCNNGGSAGATPHTWGCDPKGSSNPNQWWTLDTQAGATTAIRLAGHDFLALKVSEPEDGASAIVNHVGPLPDDLAKWHTESTPHGVLFHLAADPSLCLYTGTFDRNCQMPPTSSLPFCNKSLPVDQRVDDLVARLDVEEMATMLQNNNPGVPRLGLPVLKFNEALHGVVTGCAQTNSTSSTGCPTSFPHALAMASSFNRTLWSMVGRAIGTEARALSNLIGTANMFWMPDINLFRDPRWGRGQEVPGEDPYLNGEYVKQLVPAFQHGPDDSILQNVATTKHFIAYDQEGNGIHNTDRGAFNAVVSDQDFVEYYLPAWKAAFVDAAVRSTMCSYNALNGVPSCGNNLTMNKIAREEFGFDGFIVSDCGAVGDPAFTKYILEHYHSDRDEHQVDTALSGGCDLNCGKCSYYQSHIVDAVKKGILSNQTLQEASKRVWRQAIDLGLLDGGNTYTNLSNYGLAQVDNAAHRQLALDAALQSITLLKNEGSLLPLAKGAKVALIGPHFNATQAMLSIYRGTNTLVEEYSPLEAFQRSSDVDVVATAQGCDIECLHTSGFAAAEAAAKQADVAVVFVGLFPGQMSNDSSDAREDEGWDRHVTTLPGQQEQLIQAVLAANPKTVVVLIHGAPLSIEWTRANVPSIVTAHYPGELGGEAIRQILLGDVSPSGRLTTLFYPANITTTRPTIGDMSLRGGSGLTYKYYKYTPLFDFGFGLSYTTFRFEIINDTARVLPTTVFAKGARAAASAAYTVNVTNTGRVTSDVSVLGFVASPNITNTNKELFDFARVAALAPGQSKLVKLSVSADVMGVVDSHGVERIMPGRYSIMIGVPNAAEGPQPATTELTLVGEPQERFNLLRIKAA